MNRRMFLTALASTLAAAARTLPANKNIKWAVSAGLWSHFPPGPFTDILDVMRDTGFIGIRLTGFPGILKTYRMTAAQMEKEVSRRNLHVATISFSGPAHDPARQARVVESAPTTICSNTCRWMRLLKIFGANRLVVFPPPPLKPGVQAETPFRAMCECFNRIGEAAGEMGFQAGVHNHLNSMVEKPHEVDRCLELTDPKLFHFSPDTAHLYLGGSDSVQMLEKHKHRIVFLDYKDAKWTTPAADVVLPNGQVHPKDSASAKFYESIYDLGDGEIDFPACQRILKGIGYKGWNCVDLDVARKGPRASYERCGAYIVNRLEPIYA
ncbi:MAG: sugar phosphate isomerase/epimerase [Chloroflexi bacterium]|nr:sugar phosphate isomerase/epimerase [Chloroflexota bacterium]